MCPIKECAYETLKGLFFHKLNYIRNASNAKSDPPTSPRIKEYDLIKLS